MTEEHIATPTEMRELYKIPLRVLGLLLFLSIFVHGAFLLLTYQFKIPRPERAESIPVELVMPQARVVPDTLQETAKEKPEDAKYESARNLKTDQETSPDRAPSNVASKAGPDNKSKSASAAKSQPKIMSFSQEDMIKSGDIKKETLSGDGGTVNSPGFLDKLKKGEQLKISSMESDYGQYINRMTKKISQQWNPRRVVNTRMYNYDQVRVDIAVILDNKGQIVELRLLNGSNFVAFDDETKRAIKDASPFPNPPKSLIQDDGLIYMPWSFTLTFRQGGFYYVQ